MVTKKLNFSWLWLVFLFDVLAIGSFCGRETMGGVVLALFGVEATILYLWERPKLVIPNELSVRTQNIVFSERLDLTRLRDQVGKWSRRNFGPGTHLGYGALLGAVEELGELSHAHLKQLQGIRGTAEEHTEAAKDAIADAVIFLADYCYMRNFDFQAIIEDTWAQVQRRDWKAYPKTGLPPGAVEPDVAGGKREKWASLEGAEVRA